MSSTGFSRISSNNRSAVQRLQRSTLNGVILKPLGLSYWGIEQTDDGFTLRGGKVQQVAFSELAGPAKIGKAVGFTAIVLPTKADRDLKVAGLNANDAKDFVAAANDKFRRAVAQQYEVVEPEIRALSEAIARLDQPRRYPCACLLEPFAARAAKVVGALPSVIPDGTLTAEQSELLEVITIFAREPENSRSQAVDRFTQAELAEMKAFFDQIESNPLTPEQRLAVVTDEDATLVLAGAGSGKTSVIVAKAAYLIERGIRKPEEILLMAFGKDAAAEMAERIEERCGAAVDAMTFHALGNKIIREAEGRGPALADHASDEAKFRKLLRDILVNDVAKRAGLNKVLLEWFSEFFMPYKSEWDFKTKDEYFKWVRSNELRTLNGDRVKSREEWEIGNWLYLNGIEHEYEPVYEHELPVDARGAYKPDFRLTESGVYIEHFGVRKAKGPDGNTRLKAAPFMDTEKYLEDMEWKRRLHRENETTLIETFSYEKVEGLLLENLREKLAPYAEIKPIADDQAFEKLAEMGQVDAFTQTLGTFLRHFKSAGTSLQQCRARGDKSEDASRSHAFLKIFEPLFEAYQERLDDEIDFEDMINRATDHVESGRYQSPYRHLLVDEFQDISEGRARLLRALKRQHADARIFAVGDDWQSIFRFAGSDIHLMRDFGEEFGGHFAGKNAVHSTVDLGRTFRSVDKIALPARRFVLQNPAQIEKKVVTAAAAKTSSIMVTYYEFGQEPAALKETLAHLQANAAKDTSVLLLGRYNHLRPKNLRALEAEFPKLSLSFKTAHGSKGLEADHVIILRASSDTMGFPSEIVDDPLLDLVLPKPEKFDHAEERRLFYVALTRARKTVTILADRDKPSVFVTELVDDRAYETVVIGEPGIAQHRCGACGGRMLAKTGKKGGRYYACENRPLCEELLRPCSHCGKDLPVQSKTDPGTLICSCGAEFPACPACEDGWLVERSGRYGKFLGCVKYPACKGKSQSPSSARS